MNETDYTLGKLRNNYKFNMARRGGTANLGIKS